MKTLKIIICVVLVGTLLFPIASCGRGKDVSNNGPGVGRYVETDITPPVDGSFVCYLTEDDTLVCFDEGLKNRYESSDGGESWSLSPGPGSGSDEYRFVQTGTLFDDGSLLVFIPGEGLTVITASGSRRPYPVDDLDRAIANGENVMVTLMQALKGDRLLLSYMVGGMSVISTQGAAPVGGGSGPVELQPGETTGGSGPVELQPGEMTGGSGPIEIQPGTTTGGGPVPIEIQPGTTTIGPAPAEVQPGTTTGSPTRPGEATGPIGPGGEGRPTGGTTSGSGSATMGGMPRPKTLLLDMASGRVVSDIQLDSVVAAISDDESIYILGADSKVTIFTLDNGTPSGKPDVRFGSAPVSTGPGVAPIMMMNLSGGDNVLARSVDGGLYSVRDGSLLFADADGNVSTALESTAYSIGAPRSSISAVLTPKDGSIIVNLTNSSQVNRLYKYIWDADATVNPEKILVVWSLEDNSFVRAAIADLRTKHPDSYITYEVALGSGNAVSASDAIRTLNTRLLSGNAPDIIILDDCPVDSYAGRGMLLDIGVLIDTSDVFVSLLEPYIDDGCLYCLPTQFFMPLLLGNADDLSRVSTLADLVSLAVNGNDLPADGGPGAGPFTAVDESQQAAIYFSSLKEMCEILWTTSAPAIVIDNRLDLDALYRYIDAVKALSDKYDLTEETQGRGGLSVGFADSSGVMTLPGSLVWYTMQRTKYAAFSAGNLQLLQMMMDRVGSELSLFPGLAPGVWLPSTVAGISADTDNPLFAAELLQTMLDVAVQQYNFGTGLPVTGAGFEAQINSINERRTQGGLDSFSFDADTLVGQLRRPSAGDIVLTDMMWSSIERCCKGEIDVEGAVREIEQNIKNYLAERS